MMQQCNLHLVDIQILSQFLLKESVDRLFYKDKIKHIE